MNWRAVPDDMSNTVSLSRDVSDLLGWLDQAPAGTLVLAAQIAERVRSLPVAGGHPEPVTADSEPLLTADQVAAWLQVDRQRVYRMARDGRLQCVRIGGNTVRFRRQDVEKWLQRRGQ